jgi:glutamine amidotransferase
MGNLRSVQKAFEHIGRKAVVTSSRSAIKKAGLVVLPGVGEFSTAMKNLKKAGLTGTLLEVITSGKPFLGLCLGLQILFERSEEGGCEGLGILRGQVKRFPAGLKVPHMGWNGVNHSGAGRVKAIFKGLPDDSYFYFVHSYYVVPEDKNVVAATTDYGAEFVSAVCRENIFATQFHPEKSQKNGLRLLKNYVDNTCY